VRARRRRAQPLPGARAKATPVEKLRAAAKRQQTRELRGTKGLRQRRLITVVSSPPVTNRPRNGFATLGRVTSGPNVREVVPATLGSSLLWGVGAVVLDILAMFTWMLGAWADPSGPHGSPGGVVWYLGTAVSLFATLCGVHALKLAVQVGWRGAGDAEWAWLAAVGSLLAAAFGGLCVLGYGLMTYFILLRR
jgi:hypothetical protein